MSDYSQFSIGFDQRDRARLHELWDGVIDSQRWSEGDLTAAFEQAWSDLHSIGSVAFSGWTGAARTAPSAARVAALT